MRKQLLKLTILVLLPFASFAQSHDFCEGDVVTTNEHHTGTVYQVFPDGIIKVKIANNIISYHSSRLSKPISCLEGICVNDIVTTSDHRTGTVYQVFPDGFVRINIRYHTYGSHRSKLALYRKCSQYSIASCHQ